MTTHTLSALEQNHRRILFLRLHFFVFSLGVFSVASSIAFDIYHLLVVPKFYSTVFTDWARLTAPSKAAELLSYIFSVAALGAYYAATLFAIRKGIVTKIAKAIWASNTYGVLYLALALVFNLSLYFVTRSSISEARFFLQGVWLVLLIWPIAPLLAPFYVFLQRLSLGVVPKLLLLAMFAQCLWMFFPYITGSIPISNDYLDIPESTKIGERYVDNHEFINQRQLFGLTKYNPLEGMGKSPKPAAGTYIPLKKTTSLEQFIQRHSGIKYYYSDELAALVVHGEMRERERKELLSFTADDAERRRIVDFFFAAKLAAKRGVSYTPDEIEFVRKNEFQLMVQAYAGYYFHHHNHMVGVINELSLGKNSSDINFFYGWLNTVAVKTLIDQFGGLTFSRYLSALYSFYPLYYLLFAGALFLIFKDIGYVVFATVVAFSFLQFLGFYHIHFAPGYNPLRHFLDLFVVMFVVLHLRSDRFLYFVLGLFFAVLSVFASREFGLLIFASFLGMYIIRGVMERRFGPELAVLAVVTLAGGVVGLLGASAGHNSTMSYMLMGVSVPLTHFLRIYFLLAVVSSIYFVLLLLWKSSAKPLLYLSCMLFLYVQGALIYYVWNPAPNHFQAIAPIWALLGTALIALLLHSRAELALHEKPILGSAILVALLTLYLPSTLHYYGERTKYERIFIDHRLYKWDLERAQITTNMNPVPFEDAVKLIQKYSTKPIYLISKYDNFLPFLSGRYSAMPFLEVSLSLVTDREKQLCIDRIKNDKPAYLFVDTDIDRNLGGDVYNKLEGLSPYNVELASRGRVMVLNHLKSIFHAVDDQYELLERGLLVTVYKRK